VFVFSLASKKLLISYFFWWPHPWAMCYSAFNYLCIFCCCLCSWVLLLFHCDQIECRGVFLFSYVCWGLLCALRNDQFWRKFHRLLRRMYLTLFLEEIFCRHQIGSFDLWCHLVLGFHCWFFFCWDNMSIGDRGLLNPPTTTVLESLCAFKSFTVCLMKMGTLIMGAYRLGW
jgi:hypothetical protein